MIINQTYGTVSEEGHYNNFGNYLESILSVILCIMFSLNKYGRMLWYAYRMYTIGDI